MKFNTLSMLGLAVATVGLLAYSDAAPAAGGGTERFDRTKPHTSISVQGVRKGQPQRPGLQQGGGAQQHQGDYPNLRLRLPNPYGPLPGAPNSGFCGSSQGGGAAKYVTVHVVNKGTAPAGMFKVRVTFTDAPAHAKTVEKDFGPFPVGPTADLAGFPIPNSAWSNGMARFVIQIDPYMQIDEGGKAGKKDNTKESYCVAAAG
ncbi:MAG TPA: hypothetical protein EYP07_06775 [Kiloniellaceae bacterium]|nr:hypothetical protein [Kiloniellaceae bacterium]